MYIPQLHDYSATDTHETVTEPFFKKDRLKRIEDEIQQIIRNEHEVFQEYANQYISDLAAGRAEEFIERVLKGDDEAARVLFVSESDRYRGSGRDAGEPWASLIHGSVFETDGIQLRRKIVEAHADLIQGERIKDLESIVSGLSKQIKGLESELESTRERLR